MSQGLEWGTEPLGTWSYLFWQAIIRNLEASSSETITARHSVTMKTEGRGALNANPPTSSQCSVWPGFLMSELPAGPPACCLSSHKDLHLSHLTRVWEVLCVLISPVTSRGEWPVSLGWNSFLYCHIGASEGIMSSPKPEFSLQELLWFYFILFYKMLQYFALLREGML